MTIDEHDFASAMAARQTAQDRPPAGAEEQSGGAANLLHRPRRLRRTHGLRALVRETRLGTDDLVLPVFVTEEPDAAHEVPSMPGVFQFSPDRAAGFVEEAASFGIRAVLVFGLPAVKDAQGSRAFAPDGIAQEGIRGIRERVPDMVIIADTCMCEYTDHGHCGILDEHLDVDNDHTLETLARIAVSQADAGADVIAPSGMIDGMVGAIRAALDRHGHTGVSILSYSTKYASAFYGPFRDAARGAPAFGNRRTHQMDPANVREALRENALDVAEGADMLMVKPALAYLDVVRQTRAQFPALPLVAYNVSGEYAMVKAAAAAGWLDERSVVLELLTGMKRAGADLIITYHAAQVARWLRA